MERFSLANLVIAVTGASGLLGQQHCAAIADSGGMPVLVDIDLAGMQAVANILKKNYGVSAPYYAVDICDESQVLAMADAIEKQYGRLDGLVNNAARNPKMDDETDTSMRLETFSLDEWNKDFSVCVTGAFLCVKHLAPLMRITGGGSIVNIASDLGVIAPDQRIYADYDGQRDQPNVKPVSYSVTKHALIGLTKYIATYWPLDGIRANTLCPGGVENGQTETLIEQIQSRIPMGRMACPSEYRGALQFLLSDASAYMNGQTLVIDGGRTIW